MKKSITKALAVFMSLMLVLMSAFPAMAENSSEVEAYLNSTYAKAIDPYGSLKKDDEGRYIIPLSKTSVSLKIFSPAEPAPIIMTRLSICSPLPNKWCLEAYNLKKRYPNLAPPTSISKISK